MPTGPLQSKHPGARILVWLSALTVLVLLIWSAFAELDEVTRGEGKVIPSRQIQILQSLDGGIVSEILAREGQVVKTGDLLLKVRSDADGFLAAGKPIPVPFSAGQSCPPPCTGRRVPLRAARRSVETGAKLWSKNVHCMSHVGPNWMRRSGLHDSNLHSAPRS